MIEIIRIVNTMIKNYLWWNQGALDLVGIWACIYLHLTQLRTSWDWSHNLICILIKFITSHECIFLENVSNSVLKNKSPDEFVFFLRNSQTNDMALLRFIQSHRRYVLILSYRYAHQGWHVGIKRCIHTLFKVWRI